MKRRFAGGAMIGVMTLVALGACGGSTSSDDPRTGGGAGGTTGGGAGGTTGAGGVPVGGASGTDGGSPAGSGGLGGGPGGMGGSPGLCLLNDCNTDADCTACSFDRHKCKPSEHRCVACDLAAGIGCPVAQYCTSFGTCAPAGQTCPTDSQGEPTIACQSKADCAACDPLHQLCDVSKKKCVACTDTDSSQCSASQLCASNACQDRCPSPCSVDADCSQCGFSGPLGGMKAHACHQQVCSECSPTFPCPPGTVCQKGDCVKPCGLPAGFATCTTVADCMGCGAGTSTTSYQCLQGKCVIGATGCAELALVGLLPTPWDQPGNLCANDTNCAGVATSFNVGALVRNLLGNSELDIGIKKLKMADTFVAYPTPKCASVSLASGVTCGVCTPCLVDADCPKIPLATLVFDLFKGDPLAQLGGAMLLDLLFAKGDDKSLFFQCLPVAPGASICAPCPDPTKPC